MPRYPKKEAKKPKKQVKYPARFNQSRTRYVKNKRFSNSISKFAETKLLPCKELNESKPYETSSALSYYNGWVIGDDVPVGWDANIFPIGGMSTVRGVDAGDRIGNFVYLKKTHFTLNIDMNTGVSALQGTALSEFRLVVCKMRSQVTPTDQIKLPSQSLFLNLAGLAFGYQSAGLTPTDLMCQPLNRRDWVILKDHKFTLTCPPTLNTGAGLPNPQAYSQRYPSTKTVVIDLPYYKKTRYEFDQTNTAVEPVDLNYQWAVFLFSKPVGQDTPALNFETNLRAVTSFQDL